MMEVSSGWLLQFSADEKEDEKSLLEFLELNGYTQDKDGIKKFLLDTIYGEKKKPNKLLDAINDNPEAVQQALNGFGNLASTFLNKKLFGKK